MSPCPVTQPCVECRMRRKGVEKTVFYTNYSAYEGEPVRLYRTPGEIRRDISEIKDKIRETGRMLNTRHILTEMIDCLAEGDPEGWIPALGRIVDDAESSLLLLRELKETLGELGEELRETKWAMRA